LKEEGVRTGGVVIIDARKATIVGSRPQMLQSGSNIDLQIVKPARPISV
jgi:hypothetical protein